MISNFHDNIGNESLGPREPFPESGEAKKAPFRSIRTLEFPDPNPFLTSFGKRAKVLEARDRQGGGGMEGGRTRTTKPKFAPNFLGVYPLRNFPAIDRKVFMGLSNYG